MDPLVSQSNDLAHAAEILNKFILNGLLFMQRKLLHKFGIRTTEAENILIIITHKYYSHFLISIYQRLYQLILVRTDVLRFIYNQYIFRDAADLYFIVPDLLHGRAYYRISLGETAHLT